MEEMIEHCLLHLDEFNKKSEMPVTEQEAREGMKLFFPTLKRWSKAPKSATDGENARF